MKNPQIGASVGISWIIVLACIGFFAVLYLENDLNLLITSILSIVLFLSMLALLASYKKDKARRDIINIMRTNGTFTIAEVKSWYPHSHWIPPLYIYFCKDIHKEVFYSSDQTKKNLQIGDKVRVYHDDIKYPNISWIDIDNPIEDNPA